MLAKTSVTNGNAKCGKNSRAHGRSWLHAEGNVYTHGSDGTSGMRKTKTLTMNIARTNGGIPARMMDIVVVARSTADPGFAPLRNPRSEARTAWHRNAPPNRIAAGMNASARMFITSVSRLVPVRCVTVSVLACPKSRRTVLSHSLLRGQGTVDRIRRHAPTPAGLHPGMLGLFGFNVARLE